MRKISFFLLSLLLISSATLKAEDGHSHSKGPSDPHWQFIQNNNQWEDVVRYRSIREGNQVYMLDRSIVFRWDNLEDWAHIHSFLHGPNRDNPTPEDMKIRSHVYEMQFLGANSTRPKGEDKIDFYHNYFLGNDPAKWAGGVPIFHQVRYPELYPGTDMVVLSQEGSFKYEFHLKAQANPAAIRIQYKGLEGISLDNGILTLKTSVTEIKEAAPIAWQWINGRQVMVPCKYVLNGETISFQFPKGYDRNHPLVIDPVLVAATYCGSTSSVYGHTCTYDDLGNIYGGGAGFSGGGFPTTVGVVQFTQMGGRESCIEKLNADGSLKIWATYLGGSGDDLPHSLVTNANGDIWVLGSSSSSDYPVSVGGFQTTNGGGADIVITHLDPTATILVGSTYIGGTGIDGQNSVSLNYGDNYRGEVILDASDNCYVASMTRSGNFPTTTGAYQSTLGGLQDGVVFKMNPNLSTMIFSTFIGGVGNDAAYGVSADGVNGVYVAGCIADGSLSGTAGNAFPTNGGGAQDGYIALLNATGTAMVDATYFGGTDTDQAFFIQRDNSGAVYILGQSQGTIAATPGRYAWPTVSTGNNFICKFTSDLAVHQWTATYSKQSPTAFLVDICGYIYAAGHGGTSTLSNWELDPSPIQGNWGGFYLLVLEPDALGFNYGTFYGSGGSHVDGGTSRFDRRGIVYEGTCTSAGFPTTPWAQYPASSAGWDIAPFKIDFQLASLNANASASPSTTGCTPFTVNFTNTSSGNAFIWDFGDGSPTTNVFAPSHTYTTPGTFTVTLVAIDSGACAVADTLQLTIVVNQGQANASFNYTVDCITRSVTISSPALGTLVNSVDMGDATIVTNQANFTHSYANPGNYTITYILTDTFCFASDTVSANIYIAPPISAAAVAAPTLGCAPFTTNFTNNGSSGNNILWDFGDGNTTSSVNPSHTYQTPGTYTAWLYVYDSASCNIVDSSSVNIQVNGSPTALVSPAQTICYGGSVTLNASGGATYLWTPSSTLSNNSISNPIASPLTNTTYQVIVTSSLGCSDTAWVNVDVISIQVDAGPIVSFCDGTGGTQLFGSVISGGTAPYYYQWWCDSTNTYCGLDSVFDNDPIANPNQTTTYYLQVTDFNGCTSFLDSTIVTVLPLPIVDAGPDHFICPDSAPGTFLNPTITGAPGPYGFSWSPTVGLNNPNILNPFARPDTTTIYTLQVVAANGCVSQTTTVDTLSTVVVNVHPQPIAQAGPDRDLCLGEGLQLQGFGFGAGPNYNFEWSPYTGLSDTAIANPLASPNATTDYILTVWSNGCPGSDTVTVRVHTLPTASAGPQTDICLGESAPLSASASGDPFASNYTFEWTPGASLSNPFVAQPYASPDSSTWYYVVATSEFGCKGPADSVLIVVKPTPVAEAGPQQTLCGGDSVQLLGGYYYTTTDSANSSQIYYAWTPGNGLLSDSTVQNPWVAPGQSGFYYLEVRHNTCVTRDSVLVTAIPDLGGWAQADTHIVCEGLPVRISAGGGLGGALVQWYPPTGLDDPFSLNPVATPTVSTTYTMVLTESGCTDTIQVPIEVLPMPDLALLTSFRRGCAPLTVNFMDNSADLNFRTWNFGDGSQVSNEQNPVHTYDQPGTYSVSLLGVSVGGCKTTNTDISIDVLDPGSADFTSSTGFPATIGLPASTIGFIDQSQLAASWGWEFGDGEFSSEQHPSHQYNTPGTYFITLTTTTPDGCVSKVQHGPLVVLLPDLFIPNVFSPNSDGINDGFRVDYTGNQPFTIRIFDRWGATMFTSKDKLEFWHGVNLKGENVPEGVYYYAAVIGGKEYVGEVTLLR